MRRIKFLAVLILGYVTANAQLNTEKTFIDWNNVEMPSTPNAASLGTYGNIPVNAATGVPNINIPLYTLEVDGLSIPISLSYHASGIQVNELATAVGLKWTLNAGGGIFRSVSSKPDENGWLVGDEGPISDDFYDDFIINNEFMQSFLTGTPNSPGLAELRDHNPDQYNYNFLGYSGKFITDFNSEIIKNQADNIMVDPSSLDSRINPAAVDQMGNKYFFGLDKEVSNKSFSTTSARTGGGLIDFNGYSYDDNIVTGWMLDSISTKNAKTILFKYDPYTINEHIPHTVANTIAYSVQCAFEIDEYAEKTSTSVINDYTVQLITEISSESVKIFFDYEDDNNASLWKKKLTKITIHDKHTNSFKEFHFEYGYYGNDPRLKLTRVYEKKGTAELPGYTFTYIDGHLPDKYDFSQDFFGYYNGKNNNSLAPKDQIIKDGFFQGSNVEQFYDSNTGDRNHDFNYLKIGVLESIKYPTGGSTKFSYQANAVYDTIFQKDKYCGGLRVSKIEDRNNNNDILKTTVYNYEGLEGDSYVTNFENLHTQVDYYGSGYQRIKDIFHSSFVAEPDLVQNGYFYKKVTQSVTENGKLQSKESHFIENLSFGTRGFLLSKEKVFSGNALAKITEYEYERFGVGKSVSWNILGHSLCIAYEISYFSGYGLGRKLKYSGNTTHLPTFIATTDILKRVSVNDTVTTIQEFDYDDETLLKVQEISDTQRTRVEDPNGVVSYPVRNPNGESITVDYKYPFVPMDEGFDPEFPKGLMIRKEVTSDRHDGKIFGQAYEYDAVGNITKTYQYNKGAKTNNNPLDYIPPDYEYISSFTYKDGKPVQMRRTNGQEVSYIWGYNGQYPVAKVEGVKRWTLEQINGGQLVNSIESTTDEGTLRNLLTQLREHASTSNGMVTTFTYEPLNGVKTITDPKGEKQTFEYDSFGRLVLVRDNDNNILSENEYNYGN